jgi:hypothetical protein
MLRQILSCAALVGALSASSALGSEMPIRKPGESYHATSQRLRGWEQEFRAEGSNANADWRHQQRADLLKEEHTKLRATIQVRVEARQQKADSEALAADLRKVHAPLSETDLKADPKSNLPAHMSEALWGRLKTLYAEHDGLDSEREPLFKEKESLSNERFDLIIHNQRYLTGPTDEKISAVDAKLARLDTQRDARTAEIHKIEPSMDKRIHQDMMASFKPGWKAPEAKTETASAGAARAHAIDNDHETLRVSTGHLRSVPLESINPAYSAQHYADMESRKYQFTP